MAEQPAQESTLQRITDQLMLANGQLAKTPEELAAIKDLYGVGVDVLKEGNDEAKKIRSDAGKTHKKREAHEKESDKDRSETHKKLGFIGGILNAGKKLAEAAAKKAQVAKGKLTDFAKNSVDGIKKAAGNLMDFLKKGLGLALLWLLFKAIQAIDIESLISGAKKVGEAIVGIGDFMFTLATRIGAWMGIEKIMKLFTGKEGKLTTKITKLITKFTGKGSFFSKISGIFTKIGGLFGKIPGLKGILKFIKGAAKFLGKIFVPVTVIMALWEAVTGFMDGFANTEGNMFQKILGGIGGAVKSLLDFFVFGIADMIQSAVIWLLELFGFDSAAVAVGDFNLVGRIKDAVFKAIDYITELFSFRDTSFSGIAKSLIDILFLPLNLAINFVKDLFGWGDPEKPFSFSGFLFGMFDTVWKWITEELFVNPVEALTGLVTGLLGGYVGFLDWILAMIKKPVVWLLEMFGWDDAAGAVEKFTLKGFIAETWGKVKFWLKSLLSWASDEEESDSIVVKYAKKAILAVKEWFSKMFKFDSASDILASIINVLTFMPNLVKDAVLSVTEWLLGLFGFDDTAKKVANAKNFSIGDMVMNAITGIVEWLEKLFDIDIGMILSNVMGALGDAGKKVLGWLGFGDDEKVKEGKQSAAGGPIGKGEATLVGEMGPELFVPSGSGRILPKAQTATALGGGGGGGAPTIINAPTTVNKGGGSSTMVVASSSINPMHNKYFRN